MIGKTNKDIEHYNPRCNARGTIKAGTEVRYSLLAKLWVVTHHHDVMHFMHITDFQHSYVDVPADAVTITEDS